MFVLFCLQLHCVSAWGQKHIFILYYSAHDVSAHTQILVLTMGNVTFDL